MTTFTRLEFKRGKSKTAKVGPGQAQSVLTVAINRYHCGMTVGHGWYKNFVKQNQPGDACAVLGWFDDGRVSAALPEGGVGIVGRGDVEITSWPDYATEEQRASWDALPKISLVKDAEMEGSK